MTDEKKEKEEDIKTKLQLGTIINAMDMLSREESVTSC